MPISPGDVREGNADLEPRQMVEWIPSARVVGNPYNSMLLKARAEAIRQERDIALVTDGQKMWLWRKDWLKAAFHREITNSKRYKRNIHADLKVLFITDIGKPS